ncbi:MAG TPA: glycosyltransferase [Acidobacteriota bacterium]|nr:glycosyltransferase [Acidobacteriota bacterium]
MMLRLLLWLFHLPLQLLLLASFALTDLLRALSLPLKRLFRARREPAAPVQTDACSVVMLNWNGRRLMEESLPPLMRALETCPGDHEVLVVDNGSEDDSLAWLDREYPQVRVLALPRNLGFSQGNNRGVEAACRDIVVLLNNDMIVEENFLAPLLEPFQDEQVFAVSAQIFFPPGRRREETGNTSSWLRRGRLEMAHNPLGRAHENRSVLPVLWAGGGSTAFHRSRFLQLGGFSHLYSPVYVEDADLSYRAWRRGWKVLLASPSRVLHKHRSSSSRRFEKRQLDDIVEERRLWYLWRNHPWSWLLPHFFLYAGHLTDAISPTGYWKALRKLPRVLALRLAEPPRRWSDARIRGWIETPFRYLDRFHPRRAELSRDPSRLRILIVSAYLPHLGYHGGGGRVFQLLRQVSGRHQVSLAAFVESDKEKAEISQVAPHCHRIEVIRRGRYSPVSPFPYEPFEEFNCPRFRRLLERMLAEEDFDLVHFEWTQMVQYQDLFPHTPSLVTEIEVNYMAHWTQVQVESNPWRKLRKTYNTLQTLYREVEMCRRVDKVICVTDDDRDYLRGYLPGDSLEVVNTGVDTRFYTVGQEEDVDRNAVVFVGAFRHDPNIDAMHFFCRDVFPLILRDRPNTHLYIVGSSPPASIRKLADHPQITVTGFVEDLRDYYDLAQVVVVPLRTGVGIRGKVLEGWSAGKAMVATRLACQGIRALHGENILVADDPRDIARWTLALLRHPEFARRLGRAGRATVEERYDWVPLGERMSGVYSRLLGVQSEEDAKRGAA